MEEDGCRGSARPRCCRKPGFAVPGARGSVGRLQGLGAASEDQTAEVEAQGTQKTNGSSCQPGSPCGAASWKGVWGHRDLPHPILAGCHRWEQRWSIPQSPHGRHWAPAVPASLPCCGLQGGNVGREQLGFTSGCPAQSTATAPCSFALTAAPCCSPHPYTCSLLARERRAHCQLPSKCSKGLAAASPAGTWGPAAGFGMGQILPATSHSPPQRAPCQQVGICSHPVPQTPCCLLQTPSRDASCHSN